MRVIGTFPENTHEPILYPAALTKDAKPDASAFLAYLKRPRHPRRSGTRRIHRAGKIGLSLGKSMPDGQSVFDMPAKKPRLGPNCGAPTPMPEPSRIS